MQRNIFSVAVYRFIVAQAFADFDTSPYNSQGKIEQQEREGERDFTAAKFRCKNVVWTTAVFYHLDS